MLAPCCCSAAKTAQAASVIVGLCGGTLGTAPKSKPGSGEISAACILPKSLLADYAGMKITKMRVGIATNSGFTDMHCWVRTALTANDLGSASLTTPAVGWNEVTLSEPVTIRRARPCHRLQLHTEQIVQDDSAGRRRRR